MSDSRPVSMTRRSFLVSGAALAAAAAGGRVALAEDRAPPYPEYGGYDAVGLAELVRTKQASPAELLDAAIARTEAVNPRLNAVVIEHFDRARAAVARGLPDGPLRGVPFLLKDLNVALEGTVTSQGSRFFAGAVADYTSTLVERYRRAGLVIFGKTASPEFGATASTESTLWGDTHNPWNLAYSAGGSSGGAAAAVAAGILPAAHASDGGGSIRIPAANCGLFGLKPTRSRNPQGPYLYEGWSGMSVQHAVSRTVRDSAALLDATQGSELGDAYVAPPRTRPFLEETRTPPGKLRVGVQKQSIIPTAKTHSDCARAADEAALLCDSLGHHVDEIAAPKLPLREYFTAVGVITGTGTLLTVQARERTLGRPVGEADLEPLNWRTYQQSLQYTAAQYEEARQTLHRVGRLVAQQQQAYDVVLSPTMAAPPMKLGRLSLAQPYEQFIEPATAASAFTMIYNATGQPAMSVPLHWNEQGLPVGVMFAAPIGGEPVLFRLAAQLEAARPWRDRRPPV